MGAVQAEEDSSDEDEDDTAARNAKFGEPLTRTKAQDGSADRPGSNSFASGQAEDDEKVRQICCLELRIAVLADFPLVLGVDGSTYRRFIG